jgi:hypothetical protein
MELSAWTDYTQPKKVCSDRLHLFVPFKNLFRGFSRFQLLFLRTGLHFTVTSLAMMKLQKAERETAKGRLWRLEMKNKTWIDSEGYYMELSRQSTH